MKACSFIYKCKQRENMKKLPYFQFELKRRAKNWQGSVIIDFSHISKDGGRKYIIFNKDQIFLGAGKNYPPPPPPTPPLSQRRVNIYRISIPYETLQNQQRGVHQEKTNR